VVFSFQAEDGIRDRSVTGVQTCALTIFIRVHKVNKATINTTKNLVQSLCIYRHNYLSTISFTSIRASNLLRGATKCHVIFTRNYKVSSYTILSGVPNSVLRYIRCRLSANTLTADSTFGLALSRKTKAEQKVLHKILAHTRAKIRNGYNATSNTGTSTVAQNVSTVNIC